VPPPATAGTPDARGLHPGRVESAGSRDRPAARAAAGSAARHLRTAVALLRCDQWIKNVFVFGGLLFGGLLAEPRKWASAGIVFLLFSLVASAAYVQNDLADREADRAHPRKRRRPLAAGAVAPPTARVVQALLLAAGLGGALAFDPHVAAALVAYLALNVAYTAFLKTMVVLDVMAIAVGFVLRVVAGCLAVAVEPSVWILLCTFLLALFLGFGKRRHELLLAEAGMQGHRTVLDEYGIKFLDQMIVVVSTLTLTCYIMFTVWPETVERHGTPNLVYTVPIVLYGLFRYDYLIYRAEAGGSPTDSVLTDGPLLATIVLWALACAAILYAT
jgi:4-hydroxybenzoate polyprenyltransferase